MRPVEPARPHIVVAAPARRSCTIPPRARSASSTRPSKPTKTPRYPLAAGQSLTFDATAALGAPAGADSVKAVALDIDARQPTDDGWLSVYSGGSTDPAISSVAYDGGTVLPGERRPVCDVGWEYDITGYANSFKPVTPIYSNDNGTSRSATSTFSATTAGTVGVTVSSEIKISAGFILESAEAKLGVNLSKSITTTIGNSISVTAPPHTTVNGQYGIKRKKTTGYLAWDFSNCAIGAHHPTTAWSPWNVGWHLWEG